MMEHAVSERKDSMKLEDLLKNSPDILAAVNAAIEKVNEGETDKLKHVRFADLSEGGYVSKDKHTALETDLAGKTSELEKANNLIAELRKATGKDEELQGKITAYETEVANLRKENEVLKTEGALKFALLSAGAVDVDYLLYKAKEKGEIKLDENGKVKGENDLISGLKTQHPAMFSTQDNQQNQNRRIIENNLPGGGTEKTVTKEEFSKMGYQQKLKLFNENPDLYNELSNKKG